MTDLADLLHMDDALESFEFKDSKMRGRRVESSFFFLFFHFLFVFCCFMFQITPQLFDKIKHFARFPQTGVSLRQMVMFGRRATHFAKKNLD